MENMCRETRIKYMQDLYMYLFKSCQQIKKKKYLFQGGSASFN